MGEKCSRFKKNYADQDALRRKTLPSYFVGWFPLPVSCAVCNNNNCYEDICIATSVAEVCVLLFQHTIRIFPGKHKYFRN